MRDYLLSPFHLMEILDCFDLSFVVAFFSLLYTRPCTEYAMSMAFCLYVNKPPCHLCKITQLDVILAFRTQISQR
jgi:hypothetical protein